jgi:hypothetical protein
MKTLNISDKVMDKIKIYCVHHNQKMGHWAEGVLLKAMDTTVVINNNQSPSVNIPSTSLRDKILKSLPQEVKEGEIYEEPNNNPDNGLEN